MSVASKLLLSLNINTKIDYSLDDYKKELIFGKIDVDESPILAQKFNVHGIPAIIIFSNGVPVGLNSGFMDKNRLVDFIEDSLANKI